MRFADEAAKGSTLCHRMRHEMRLACSTCDGICESHMLPPKSQLSVIKCDTTYDSHVQHATSIQCRIWANSIFFFRKNQKNLTTFGSNGPLESLLPYEDLKVFKNTRTSQKFNYPQINSKLTQISDLSSLQCREQSPIGFNLQLHLLQQDPLSSS